MRGRITGISGLKLFPRSRRQWLWLALRLGILFLAFAAAGLYMTRMPGESHRGPLAPLSSDEIQIGDNLRRHVVKLAGEIGERSMRRHDGLTAAADYIRDVLAAQGWRVAEQAFESEGRTVRNIEVEVHGASRPDEILVIGAHYD